MSSARDKHCGFNMDLFVYLCLVSNGIYWWWSGFIFTLNCIWNQNFLNEIIDLVYITGSSEISRYRIIDGSLSIISM